MSRSLPPRPSLHHLQQEAKNLLKAHKAGDASCCAVLRRLKQFEGKPDAAVLAGHVSLVEVQYALAMDYGFESWSELKKYVRRTEIASDNLGHWARGFGKTLEEKVRRVCNDPEWAVLLDQQAQLEPLTKESRSIRGRIAQMEACHDGFEENVRRVLGMIASMTPGRILDCGQVGGARASKAKSLAAALQRWLNGETSAVAASAEDRMVAGLLGAPDDRKKGLVAHLLRKLEDNSYHAYPWDQEDFEKTESRITHLEICAHYWEHSLRVLLEEIGTGCRARGWHSADGFNACGDAPDHPRRLAGLLAALDVWLSGSPGVDDETANSLGEQTPEKVWLVASLRKHISCASDMARIISC